MPDIAAFHGLHFDPSRVDLGRALGSARTPAPATAPAAQATQAPAPAAEATPVEASGASSAEGSADASADATAADADTRDAAPAAEPVAADTAAEPVAADTAAAPTASADPRDAFDPRRLLDADGAAVLDDWLARGALVRDASRSVYRYVQIGPPGPDGRPLVRRGLIAAVRLAPYSEGRIQPHLRTTPHARDEQLALLRATGLHATPITALYADAAGEVERLLRGIDREQPTLDVTTPDGIRHQLWRTSNAELIGKLRRALGVKKLVLADGHHRYEAMLAWHAELSAKAGKLGLAQYSSAQYATMLLVEQHDAGLVIGPAHRLLTGVEGFDLEQFLARARDYFIVDPVPGAANDPDAVGGALESSYGHQPAFVVIVPGRADGWRLTLAPNVNLAALGITGHPSVQRLETTLVHAIVGARMLGLSPAALDAGTHFRYPPTTAAAQAAVAAGEVQAGFLVPASRLEGVRHVVEVGDVMPVRGTVVGPPVATGLVMRRVDPDEDLQ